MTQEQEDEATARRVLEVARQVAALLPDGWKWAQLAYHAVGSFETVVWEGDPADATATAAEELPRTEVFDRLRALRHDSYDAEQGTWTGIKITILPKDELPPDGESYEDLVASGHAADGIAIGFFVFPTAKNFPWQKEVTPADCVQELTAYPRPEEQVQWWMRWKEELHRAAEAFDPAELLARPQDESALVALLPQDETDLFDRARAALDDLLPGSGERLLIGRLDDGHWSVVQTGTVWLAVRCDGGRCTDTAAFHDTWEAVNHAMGRILAESDPGLTGGIRSAAGLPSAPWADWCASVTRWAPRPRATATDTYLPLVPVPDGAPLPEPGPPPATGPYVRAGFVAMLAAETHVPPPRGVVLVPGTEVDAYACHDQNFVYALGTPEYMRGAVHRGVPDTRHVYRVLKPLTGYPGMFSPWQPPDLPALARDGRGYGIVRDIAEWISSGHLVEVSGPGGEPVAAPSPDVPPEE